MKKKKFDSEKAVYAVAAVAAFFILWWFLTTFTPARETTPGPIAVLKLLWQSMYTPLGGKVILEHMLVSLRRGWLHRCHCDRRNSGPCHGHLQVGRSHLQAYL